MKRIFSGIQPSGGVTLGNYLGAIRNWAKLQEEDYHCIYCMVDLHAITVWQDPSALPKQTREMTAALIAAGIDPKTSIVFNQSAVAEHAELAWVFNCVARLGWMNRMTQFKEKAGKHRENASLGLYAYPALMAADILVYKATHVPVGEDQKQHLELTRDVAQKFNSDYGIDFFPLTEPLIYGAATRVMSLRDGTKKMSKSDPSDMTRINLTDDPDTIANKFRKARTDPEPVPTAPPASDEERAKRPEAYNLMGIYAALTDKTVAEVADEFGGAPFSAFKGALTDVAVAVLEPINAEMRRLMDHQDEIDAILRRGADDAREIAAPILREVYDIIGLLAAVSGAAGGGVTFRAAVHADLPALVAMLADDPLGAARERFEDPLPEAYPTAFAAIDANPWIELIVADDEGEPVGCLQLTLVPGLSRQGSTRAQIEAVRVRADRRGQGLGHAMVRHAIERARARGAALVEATSDKSRADAHRFWRDLGFANSHEGFKLALG